MRNAFSPLLKITLVSSQLHTTAFLPASLSITEKLTWHNSAGGRPKPMLPPITGLVTLIIKKGKLGNVIARVQEILSSLK